MLATSRTSRMWTASVDASVRRALSGSGMQGGRKGGYRSTQVFPCASPEALRLARAVRCSFLHTPAGNKTSCGDHLTSAACNQTLKNSIQPLSLGRARVLAVTPPAAAPTPKCSSALHCHPIGSGRCSSLVGAFPQLGCCSKPERAPPQPPNPQPSIRLLTHHERRRQISAWPSLGGNEGRGGYRPTCARRYGGRPQAAQAAPPCCWVARPPPRP